MGKLENTPHCPHCKAILNGFTAVSEEDIKPSCGDVSVCDICHEILEFNESLNLIPVTSETLDHFDLRDIQKMKAMANMMASMNP